MFPLLTYPDAATAKDIAVLVSRHQYLTLKARGFLPTAVSTVLLRCHFRMNYSSAKQNGFRTFCVGAVCTFDPIAATSLLLLVLSVRRFRQFCLLCLCAAQFGKTAFLRAVLSCSTLVALRFASVTWCT